MDIAQKPHDFIGLDPDERFRRQAKDYGSADCWNWQGYLQRGYGASQRASYLKQKAVKK